MQILRSVCRRNGYIKASLIVTTCSSLVCISRAIGAQPWADRAPPPGLTDGLHGMQFAGPLAVKDETNPPKDVLSFKNGRFSSKACHRYGFMAAPYWVRRDVDGLHFLVVLKSPENGSMRFEGAYDGKKLQATALWTKERWYWTIERKFEFTGYPVSLGH